MLTIKRKVYIESTIPSFYHEVRSEPEMIARREWTREWWNDARGRYEVFTSSAVIGELEKGDYPNKTFALELMSSVPLLSIEPDIFNIVDVYIQQRVMPDDPVGDALHLALASYYKCDFLLTWNCRHLANANKFGHIRRINVRLDLFVPQLVTPLELLGGIPDER